MSKLNKLSKKIYKASNSKSYKKSIKKIRKIMDKYIFYQLSKCEDISKLSNRITPEQENLEEA